MTVQLNHTVPLWIETKQRLCLYIEASNNTCLAMYCAVCVLERVPLGAVCMWGTVGMD